MSSMIGVIFVTGQVLDGSRTTAENGRSLNDERPGKETIVVDER